MDVSIRQSLPGNVVTSESEDDAIAAFGTASLALRPNDWSSWSSCAEVALLDPLSLDVCCWRLIIFVAPLVKIAPTAESMLDKSSKVGNVGSFTTPQHMFL